MVKKLSRKEAQEVTRTRLIEVALQCFARSGFSRASVDAIAKEVGMTKGAVYANFATKEDLFLAALDHMMNLQDQSLEDILAKPGQIRLDALRAYLVQLFAQSHDWRLLVTEFWLHAARDPILQRQFALRYQLRRQKIAHFIAQYFSDEHSTFPLPAEQLASVLIALSNGLEMQQIIDSEAIPDDLFAVVLTLLIERFPS